MQKANLMNFDHNGKKINVSNDIFQNVGACYVSPLPNAICKSPSTKLNDSTSTHWSFLKKKKGLQLSLSLKDIVGFVNFLSQSAELVLLLYLGLY